MLEHTSCTQYFFTAVDIFLPIQHIICASIATGNGANNRKAAQDPDAHMCCTVELLHFVIGLCSSTTAVVQFYELKPGADHCTALLIKCTELKDL